MFVNIYMVLGLLAAIAILFYEIHSLKQGFRQLLAEQYMIAASMEITQHQKDEEKEIEFEQLKNKVEYLYEQETARLPKTDS